MAHLEIVKWSKCMVAGQERFGKETSDSYVLQSYSLPNMCFLQCVKWPHMYPFPWAHYITIMPNRREGLLHEAKNSTDCRLFSPSSVPCRWLYLLYHSIKLRWALTLPLTVNCMLDNNKMLAEKILWITIYLQPPQKCSPAKIPTYWYHIAAQ